MEYAIKLIDTNEDSLIEISKFLSESFPKSEKFTPEFIKWQYADNPLGKMVGFNVWDNNRIVSHFAGLPISMSIFGEKLKGLLCINVATNINYRGKKLFTIAGEKTIEYAKENGFDFMIAVPNANSTHGFLRYFDFDLISPLSAKVGFGKNIFSNKTFNCYKIWDEAQWQWRLSSPANNYYSDSRGILSTPIIRVAKSISKTKLSNESKKLLSNKIGFSPLNLYVGLGADISKGLYFDIPSFVKRPPFNLVFKDLRGNIPPIKKEDVFLQLIDLDTI